MELSTLSLPLFRTRRTLRATICQFGVGLLSLTEACGGDSGTTGPSGGGTFTARVSAVSVTVGRSATGTLTFTIARGSGFTGLVTCSVTGLPNGVTGAKTGNGAKPAVKAEPVPEHERFETPQRTAADAAAAKTRGAALMPKSSGVQKDS